MNKMNKKGFTLAELLIVVAIIGVLTAIAIPVFTSQLEKSREATDAANIRDYYAEISSALLTDPAFTDNANVTGQHATITISGGKTATYKTNGTTGFFVTVSDVASKQTQTNWQTAGVEVGGVAIAADNDYCGKSVVCFTFTVATAANGGNTYLSAVSFVAPS